MSLCLASRSSVLPSQLLHSMRKAAMQRRSAWDGLQSGASRALGPSTSRGVALRELDAANNQVSSEAENSLVKDSDDSPFLADNLIAVF